MAKPIELHPAFVFDCDECGRENFVREIVEEHDEETDSELRSEHSIEPYEEGHWVLTPTTVTCQHCNADFDVVFDGQEDQPDF
jgi:predicted nucleic acid-binding Zn ribbon protein